MSDFTKVNEILANYTIEELIPELNPRKKQNYYVLTCPNCGKNEAYIYDNTKVIKCNRRDKCGYEKPLITYLEERENLSFTELIAKLANDKNVSLDLNLKEYAIKRRNAGLLKEASKILHENLFEIEGNPVYRYLTEDRGYSPHFIYLSKLGYLVSLKDLKNKLKEKGYTDEELKILDNHFYHFENTHKLVIPYKDIYGNIIKFKRRILPEFKNNSIGKYVNSKNSNDTLVKDILFNLDNVEDSKTIYIVEGEFDALSLTYNVSLQDKFFSNLEEAEKFVAKKGVVATGGKASISYSQAKYLKEKFNPERVILIPDSDSAGKEHLKTSIKNLQSVGIYNIEIISIKSAKDVDELINMYGYEEFEMYKPTKFLEWMITEEIEKMTLNNEKIDYYILFQKFNNIKENYVKSEADKITFQKLFEKYFDKDIVRELIQKEKRENLKKEIQSSLNKLYKRVEDNNFNPQSLSDLVKAINNHMLKLKRLEKPTQSFKDLLNEAKLKSQNYSDLLGYKSERFKTIINKELQGYQSGFYIIAGYPNAGKTALMINFFLDALEANEDLFCTFYSLDDTKEIILYRMLAILSDMSINRVKKYEHKTQAELEALENAYIKLESLGNRIRLKDLTEIDNIEALEAEIDELYGKSNSKLMVFIDGLHNLEIPFEGSSIREENIKRANMIKKIIDIYDIPLFTTTELRKPKNSSKETLRPTMHDINETGKYAYNANLILSLYYDQEGEKALENNNDVVPVRLDFSKNKLSGYRGTFDLIFFRYKSKFEINK